VLVEVKMEKNESLYDSYTKYLKEDKVNSRYNNNESRSMGGSTITLLVKK
jgi:hypothetical protein